jgi:putative ubiquitin-RnfH superfamily antitoxin RatB of RatAB toxin-antitoxin module
MHLHAEPCRLSVHGRSGGASVSQRIKVEFVFATREKQVLITGDVTSGSTIRTAILESDLPASFPDVDFAACPLGIWGKPVTDDAMVGEGDRIEAYRALLHDPRDFRRSLAEQGQFIGSSNRTRE